MGYGEQPGLPDIETFPLGEGPSLGFGPNIHPKLYDRLMATARAHEIPAHFEPMPGASGTDAMAIQMVQAGVATAVISTPTRYMHTPVETLAVRDLERTARLLAHFIAELDADFLTTLTNY
jgi:endoglucanase